MVFRLLAVICLWEALSSLPVQAEASTPSTASMSLDYVLRTWETDEGLPSNTVTSIAQTPDGYLWLATPHRLVRFDGIKLAALSKDDLPGIQSTDAKTLFTAQDGSLWIGLERGGVARITRNHVQTIVPLGPPRKIIVACSLAEDREGGIWFGYDPDLAAFRWYQGTVAALYADEGLGPGHGTNVLSETDGTLWYFSSQACGVYEGKRFKAIDPHGGSSMDRVNFCREGGVWAVRNNQLLRYHSDGRREVIVSDMSSLSVKALYEDHAGNLWLGTQTAGLFRYRDGNFVRVPTSHTNISAITEDREGNLWVGTLGGGLDRLRPTNFYLHQIKEGLETDETASLCEDIEGKIYIVGVDGLPVRSLDSSNRSYAKLQDWSWYRSYSLYPDPAGGIWTSGPNGLIHWKNGKTDRGIKQDLTSLLVDRKGDLWMSSVSGGLIHQRNNVATTIPTGSALIDSRALAEDGAGHVWSGTEAGLVFQQQDKEQFRAIPLPGSKPDEPIRFIVPDGPDTVWIGALEGGLYRWHAGKVEQLPPNTGLPVDDLRSLAIEPDGNFWFGTGRGLFRVERNQIAAAIEGRQPAVNCISYGLNEGVPSLEFSYGFRNATMRTRDGHLWFATHRGALEITTQSLPQTFPLLPLIIEDIQVGDNILPLTDRQEFTLPAQPGPVEIHFTLPQLTAPEQIRFRYRLIGLSDVWILSGGQRTAIFPHLAPGTYRFEVAAAEGSGPWSQATTSASFTVQAAWWETGWFQWGAVLIAALAFAGLVRFIVNRRMQARIRILQQQHLLERERTRIARDIHDELGASLTQISIASQLAKIEPPETASDRIDEIEETTRRAVESLDEIVWAINPRCDTLPSLVEYLSQYAANFFTPAGIDCELVIPETLPPIEIRADVRHHLFLAIKETFNNVVKHSGARSVRFQIDVKKDALCLVVTDDGSGFEGGCDRAGADGLRNMMERMAEIGGLCRVESHRQAGTSVTFSLPLPKGRD